MNVGRACVDAPLLGRSLPGQLLGYAPGAHRLELLCRKHFRSPAPTHASSAMCLKSHLPWAACQETAAPPPKQPLRRTGMQKQRASWTRWPTQDLRTCYRAPVFVLGSHQRHRAYQISCLRPTVQGRLTWPRWLQRLRHLLGAGHQGRSGPCGSQ